MLPIRDSIPSEGRPFVVIGLIAANALVFFYELSLGPGIRELFMQYGVVPAKGLSATLLTSQFLHGGWLHVISNMWALWIFGDNVEDRLGHFRFLLFYLLCGTAAGLTHALFHPGSAIPTVGASGAIAGVMGAYFVLFPHSRVLTLGQWGLYEQPASLYLGLWAFIQIVYGAGRMGGGVAWLAHAGGFAAGFLLHRVMLKRRSPPGWAG